MPISDNKKGTTVFSLDTKDLYDKYGTFTGRSSNDEIMVDEKLLSKSVDWLTALIRLIFHKNKVTYEQFKKGCESFYPQDGATSQFLNHRGRIVDPNWKITATMFRRFVTLLGFHPIEVTVKLAKIDKQGNFGEVSDYTIRIVDPEKPDIGDEA